MQVILITIVPSIEPKNIFLRYVLNIALFGIKKTKIYLRKFLPKLIFVNFALRCLFIDCSLTMFPQEADGKLLASA